jgi:cytoskeleton-associated protein 5
MKCLWRVIKMTPTWLKDETDMFNLDDVLAEVHDFLKAYPSSYWKGRDSDTPIRTIKTVLHTCIKNLGDEVLHHLTK